MDIRDGFVEVTQEQFRDFLKKYVTSGRRLEHDCNAMGEPPIHSYYDWNLGTYPVGTHERLTECRQAYCMYDEGMGAGQSHFYVRGAT